MKYLTILTAFMLCSCESPYYLKKDLVRIKGFNSMEECSKEMREKYCIYEKNYEGIGCIYYCQEN